VVNTRPSENNYLEKCGRKLPFKEILGEKRGREFPFCENFLPGSLLGVSAFLPESIDFLQISSRVLPFLKKNRRCAGRELPF
jgi:hypothetical protein